MRKLIAKFRREEDGAAMVEYTVLLGIITVATIGTIITVGTWVSGQWEGLAGILPASPTPGPGPAPAPTP